MIPRLHLTAIILVAVGTIVLTLRFSGEAVSWAWLTSIGTSVGVTLGAMTVFDRWLWRLPFLQGWFVKRPFLWGDWQAEIKSQWEDPQTGRCPDPIPATLSIRQTFSATHVRLKTDESQGDLIISSIKEEADGRYWLYGVYRNEPDLTVRRSSPLHFGAFRLEIEGKTTAPTHLRGHYWTDRTTQGMIIAKRAVVKDDSTVPEM